MPPKIPQLAVSKQLIPSYSQLTDKAEKEAYWEAFINDWHTQPVLSHFPGCNPVSISRAVLPSLRKADYSITLKSDGVRYALYCTTRPKSTHDNPLPVALMIDRAQNMYEVDLIATEEVFTRRTILEGELVWDKSTSERQIFLIFDCIMSKGESLVSLPFKERLKEVERYTRMSDEMCTDDDDVYARVLEMDNLVMMQYSPRVVIRNKNFVNLHNAPRLWRERSDAQHRVDGLIIQKNDAAYTFGTAKEGAAFKWKEKPTVDLTGKDLCATNGKLGSRLFGRNIVVADESKIVPESDEDVIEYLVTLRGEDSIVLFALRKRVDKQTANSRRVVHATINDVIEAIGVDELGALGS